MKGEPDYQGQRVRRLDAQDEVARAAWMLACGVAASRVGVPVREVVQTRGTPGRGSSDKVARARKFACYLALVVASVEPARLARVAGLHRRTLSVHAAWVEDGRDRSEFDREVAAMEEALWGTAARIVLTRVGGLSAAEAA